MNRSLQEFLNRVRSDPLLARSLRYAPAQTLERVRGLSAQDRARLIDVARSGNLSGTLQRLLRDLPDARSSREGLWTYPDDGPGGQFLKFNPSDVGIDTPRLYPHEPSVRADGTLQMHIASNANYVKLWFYRLTGKGLVAQYGELFSNPQPGSYTEASVHSDSDWGWPSVSVDLKTAQIPAGVYVVWMEEFAVYPKGWSFPPVVTPSRLMIREKDVNDAVTDWVNWVSNKKDPLDPNVAFAYYSGPPATLVVVRPAVRQSSTLCVVPVYTYHAYNFAGGGYLYSSDNLQTVTLRRRGGGLGYLFCPAWRTPNGNLDVNRIYDPGEFVGTHFMSHDYRWITWLQNNIAGGNIDFCADSDFSADAAINASTTAGYTLMIFLGHDEYWTDEKKKGTDDFVGQGGNVAFLGGNTCWWRITHDVPNGTITCDKAKPDYWWKYANNDDARTTGLSFREAPRRFVYGDENGVHDGLQRRKHGDRLLEYRVQFDTHWIHENTEVTDGDTYGSYSAVIGIEGDGTVVLPPQGNRPVVPDLSKGWGTPSNLTLLGVNLVTTGNDLVDTSVRPPKTWANGVQYHAVCVATFTRNGTVVNLGSMDWGRAVNKVPKDTLQTTVFDSVGLFLGHKQPTPIDLVQDKQPLYYEPQAEVIARQALDRLITPGAATWACVGDPIAAAASGELFVFARGTKEQLVVRRTSAGAWTPQQAWSAIPGGVIRGQPSAVVQGGLLYVFARAADGNDLLTTAGDATGFPNLTSLGVPYGFGAYSHVVPLQIRGEPTAIAIEAGPAAGTVAVFTLASDGNIWTAWNGSWARLPLLPNNLAFAGRPQVVADSSGRLDVFARTTSGALRTCRQSIASTPDKAWTYWEDLPGPYYPLFFYSGDPTPVRVDDNNVFVFCRAHDNRLWVVSKGLLFGNANTWGYASLGEQLECRPTVVLTANKKLQVFARVWKRVGAQHEIAASGLSTFFQRDLGMPPSGPFFTPWFDIPSPSIRSRPYAIVDPASGLINVFVVEPETLNVLTCQQTLPTISKGGGNVPSIPKLGPGSPGFPSAYFTAWTSIGVGL
jgi:hypothetical protein